MLHEFQRMVALSVTYPRHHVRGFLLPPAQASESGRVKRLCQPNAVSRCMNNWKIPCAVVLTRRVHARRIWIWYLVVSGMYMWEPLTQPLTGHVT